MERALEAELTDRLGHERHQEPPGSTGITRNGSTPKSLGTEHGPPEVTTPRECDGSFDPKLVLKRQRRFESPRARVACRRVTSRLTCASSTEVSVGRDLISRVTEVVLEDVKTWQQRGLGRPLPVAQMVSAYPCGR